MKDTAHMKVSYLARRFSEWPDDARMRVLVPLVWLKAKPNGYHSKPNGGLNVTMPPNGSPHYHAVLLLMDGAGFVTDHSYMDDPATGNRVLQFTIK